VYARSANFYAMLGLGPIREGYSIIAAHSHVPSMFDLDRAQLVELSRFTREVQGILRAHYGEVLITEHGRVAPCIAPAVRAYEPHCLHAHRLLFPGAAAVRLEDFFPRAKVVTAASFEKMAGELPLAGQYLYAEEPGGQCSAVIVDRPFPRQFFRRIAAAGFEEPELADWQRFPRLDVVHDAAQRLRAA
jgi:hypothetical protein